MQKLPTPTEAPREAFVVVQDAVASLSGGPRHVYMGEIYDSRDSAQTIADLRAAGVKLRQTVAVDDKAEAQHWRVISEIRISSDFSFWVFKPGTILDPSMAGEILRSEMRHRLQPLSAEETAEYNKERGVHSA